MKEIQDLINKFYPFYPNLNKKVIDHLQLRAHPFVPEISLFCSPKLSHEIQMLIYNQNHCWQWMFLSEGSVGLARYILDNPDIVKDKVVYELGAGQGLISLSSKLAGAKKVHTIDREEYSGFAVKINSEYNQLDVNFECANLFDIDIVEDSVILASDIWYSQDRCNEITPFLYQFSKSSKIILSQPVREKYRDHYAGIQHERLKTFHSYEIPCFTPNLENTKFLTVNLYKF